MKCLVVEDDTDIRRIVAELAAEQGHEVQSFANAEDAWAAYQDSLHQLVLTDLTLPGFDGLGLCRRVRNHVRGAATVIVVMTARDGEKDVAKALDAGADDYISKPFLARDMRVHLAIAERQARVRAERVHAEHELHTLNKVLEAAVDGIVRVDGAGRYVQANETYARMLGHRVDELFGRDANDTILAADRPLLERATESMALTGWAEIELRAQRTDRTVIHLAVTLIPVADERSEPAGHFRIVKDVTARKRLEEETWRDRSFLTSIFENIPDMIFVKDAKELRFVRFNRAGEELLGFGRDELVGRNDHDFFPKAEADFFTRKDREVLDGGKVVEIAEEPIHTRFRGTRTLHTKKIPVLDESGKPQFLLGISEDVTERKRAEAALLAASRMEATATLAGGIAHDFNNLMAVVLSTTDLLRDSVGGDPEGVELVDEIAALARKGGGLARQMLAFARGGTSTPEILDLNEVVREIIGLQFRSMPAGVQIERDLMDHLWPVQADPTQMGQVVVNLCTNGVEALEGAGTLRVSTRNATLAAVAAEALGLVAGDYVELTVQDSGAGLDAETRARVFEPFFTTKFQGRGLGLSVVYGIVREHRGQISVESEIGRGTRFTVRLPALEHDDEDRSDPGVAAAAGAALSSGTGSGAR